jgi:hypothetical protein
MGAATYRVMSGYAAEGEPGTDALAAMSKVVFSTTLSEPLSWANTQLVAQDPVEAVREMKDKASNAMRTIGSLTLCRSPDGSGWAAGHQRGQRLAGTTCAADPGSISRGPADAPVDGEVQIDGSGAIGTAVRSTIRDQAGCHRALSHGRRWADYDDRPQSSERHLISRVRGHFSGRETDRSNETNASNER